jgi:hypothetical protein
MEQNLGNLQLRWNILRMISGAVAMVAFVLSVMAMPTGLGALRIAGLILGVALSGFTSLHCDWTWRRVTLVSEGTFFTLALLASVSANGPPENVPLLLLAFVTILFSEQTLHLTSRYTAQFSTGQQKLLDFNVPTLGKSLNQLCRRLALNGATYGTSYCVALSLLLIGAILSPAAPILSDISVYLLVTSIALALLITLKEE